MHIHLMSQASFPLMYLYGDDSTGSSFIPVGISVISDLLAKLVPLSDMSVWNLPQLKSQTFAVDMRDLR